MVGVGWFAAIFVGGLAGWLAERYMMRDHSLVMKARPFVGLLGRVC